MGKLRWGVLSTASIGRLVIESARQAEHAEFVAVATRDLERARAFAGELGLEASFGSYQELLSSEAVDAVYVPLPVSMHTEWTLRSLAAGKHVLCEKPFATSPEDAARCFDAAQAAGRRCVEGLMWRHHPRTTLARKLVADGAIGRLATVRAALSVSVGPGDIRRSVELGGSFNLADPDHDVYRVELDIVSAAIAAGIEPPFGRTDAIAQVTVLQALRRSAALTSPVDLAPHPAG